MQHGQAIWRIFDGLAVTGACGMLMSPKKLLLGGNWRSSGGCEIGDAPGMREYARLLQRAVT